MWHFRRVVWVGLGWVGLGSARLGPRVAESGRQVAGWMRRGSEWAALRVSVGWASYTGRLAVYWAAQHGASTHVWNRFFASAGSLQIHV